jgi:hypothetical protein
VDCSRRDGTDRSCFPDGFSKLLLDWLLNEVANVNVRGMSEGNSTHGKSMLVDG